MPVAPDTAASGSPAPGSPVLAAAPHRIGLVSLVVHDLERMTGFYRDVIGLSLLGKDGPNVSLGAHDVPLIALHRDLAARRWTRRQPGLFHTAFLLPSRADLGAWLQFAAAQRMAIDGASNHLVSEAVYLTDPEGNGIEIYADRPSADWSWQGGMVAMSTERLDLDLLMSAATGRWAGMPPGGCVGHVHLQAGDLAQAGPFYEGLLGFDVMARYPGALFFGSGGYHHQLATNVWNSRGAPARLEPTTGLAEVEIRMSDAILWDATRSKLASAAVPVETATGGYAVLDPSGTRLRFVFER